VLNTRAKVKLQWDPASGRRATVCSLFRPWRGTLSEGVERCAEKSRHPCVHAEEEPRLRRAWYIVDMSRDTLQ
jgi:hypothetical protein